MKTRTMLVVAVTLVSLLLGHSTAHARSDVPGAGPERVTEQVAERVAEQLAVARNVTFHGPDGQAVTGTMATLGLVGSGVPLAEALDRTVPGSSRTDARITYPLFRVAVEFNRAETAKIGMSTALCAAVLGKIPFWPTAIISVFCAVNSAIAAYYYARGWCSKVQSGFPIPTRLEHAPHKSSYCR